MPIVDTINNIDDVLSESIAKRREDGLYRTLTINDSLVDFCSNDYLSFARNEILKQAALRAIAEGSYHNGSTGSRSLSGNTHIAEQLEQQIAAFHHAEAGLLFNSGYDANVGLFSCIARQDDTIITDELVHASMIDGCRLSYATRFKFKHNDLTELEQCLQRARGSIFVGIESVYSMDGDTPPLREIVDLCEHYGANLIVDEAHATGVFGDHGRGVINAYGMEERVFARVHTFGKALGCHGAVVVGSYLLREYLINFARSFIFTTALPPHSIVAIKCAYDRLASDEFDNSKLHALIGFFKKNYRSCPGALLIRSSSPIQCIVISGADRVFEIAQKLQQRGFDVRAIRAPSVPVGQERLRVCLHQHNSEEEIAGVLNVLNETLNG